MSATAESPESLLDLLARADLGEIARRAADDVVFESPVAAYHGREDVLHLFGLISRVLRSPVTTETSTCGPSRFTAFTAHVAEDEGHLDGVLREQYDDRGRLLHVTLFLRPLASLRQAIGQMGRLLADSPLPSSRV